MTPEQTAALNELFTSYGSPVKKYERRIWLVHTHPDNLHTLKDISMADAGAAADMEELNEILTNLAAYRQALCERYNAVATAPKAPVVRLRRHRSPGWRREPSKVFYYLETFERNLNDGAEVKTSSTTYPGTERRKAIADFQAYVKAHPGIESEMDIEKPKWER